MSLIPLFLSICASHVLLIVRDECSCYLGCQDLKLI